MMQPMQSIMASTAIDRARGGKSGRAEAAKAAKDSINAGTLSTSPARAAVARRALTNFDPDATCVQYCMQARSEEHTSELQSLMRISYAVFCLKKKTT